MILVVIHQLVLELGFTDDFLDVHPLDVLAEVDHDSLHDIENIGMRHDNGFHLSDKLGFELLNGIVSVLKRREGFGKLSICGMG